jgi:hypothetical protein
MDIDLEEFIVLIGNLNSGLSMKDVTSLLNATDNCLVYFLENLTAKWLCFSVKPLPCTICEDKLEIMETSIECKLILSIKRYGPSLANLLIKSSINIQLLYTKNKKDSTKNPFIN